jgi:hypothetical protein
MSSSRRVSPGWENTSEKIYYRTLKIKKVIFSPLHAIHARCDALESINNERIPCIKAARKLKKILTLHLIPFYDAINRLNQQRKDEKY